MDKQQLLSDITAAASTHLATKEELVNAYDQGLLAPGDSVLTKKLSVIDLMYYIGAAIIILGIGILISQNWQYLGTPVQILVTLGSGIAAYIVGVLFNRYESFQTPSSSFFLISGIILPIGIGVLLDKLGMDVSTSGTNVIISAVLLATFLGSYFLFKKTIFTLFSILFGTWLFQALIQLLIGTNPLGQDYKIFEYRTLVTGFVYLLLGYYFNQTTQKALTGFLYGFGCLMFLGTALALGGYFPNQNTFWEVIYPIFVLGIIFFSIQAKSKSFLVFGSLFLIAYIFKLTGEYFSNSLGWPLALVVAGLLVMTIGYFAVRINKKYLKTA